MRLSKIQALLLTPLMLAGLAGCSDNEGHSGREPITPDYDAEPAGTYSGQVLDGYLRGAVVWIDLNNNRVQDPDEPFTETGTGGHFTFTREDLGCGEESKPYSCVDRPKAYPLGAKVEAGKAVDEFTRTTVDRSYYLWAPPIPRHFSRVVTPFTTLLKVERDLKEYTGQQLLYPIYTPASEAELSAEIDEYHKVVRNKLGVSQNLLLDYVSGNNARLHAYARGLVWAMQDYIADQGGLEALTASNSETVKQVVEAAYHYSPDVQVRQVRLASITGLPLEEVIQVLNDNELDEEAKIAALIERVQPMRPKMDGMGRALVHQGRWVVQAIDAAVGANASDAAYDRLAMAEVVPPIYVLERDPRVLARKKLYVHPDSQTLSSSQPLADLMALRDNTEPYTAGAALTQVQEYLYDLEGHLAQIDVYGDLLEWRRDLLLSYPVQLEALFPQTLWEARSLKLNALDSPSLRVSVDSTLNGTDRTATIQVHQIVEGEPETDLAEPAWTQVWRALGNSTEAVERVLHYTPLSLSWLRSPSRQDLGRFEEVSQETYPAMPTALESLGLPAALVPTGQDTNVALSYTAASPTALVTRIDITDASSAEARWISFENKAANRTEIKHGYQSGSVAVADGLLSYNMIGQSLSGTQFSFEPVEGEKVFEDYCVLYRYEQQHLRYEIYSRMNGSQCAGNSAFMVVEYEYAHLSELLKR